MVLLMVLSYVQPEHGPGVNSTMEVVTGAGPLPNTNAIKWVQGNEWIMVGQVLVQNVDPAI